MTRVFFALALFISVTACSVEDKPHYLILDDELRLYEGGDKLTYTTLDTTTENDNAGSYALSLVSNDVFHPDDNTVLSLLLEQQTKNGNFTLPFIPQFLSQNAGALTVEALSHSDDVLWLVDENENKSAAELYPEHIETLSELASINRSLLRCDEERICREAGQYTHSLHLIQRETITTPYATFETYKLEISLDIFVFNTEQGGNQHNYHLTGTQWLYPPLGIVKFFYNSKLIGVLSDTNISIDEKYKAE